MPNSDRDDVARKLLAAALASHPALLDHVRRTGQLPSKMAFGWMPIALRVIGEKRGPDIVLSNDERLVYDALLVRDRERAKIADNAPIARKPNPLDLIYGELASSLVFVERSIAKENIAFRSATRWGDFRIGAPLLYERAIENLEAEEEALPHDNQVFDPQEFDGDGDFAHFPEQLMLNFIPEAIQERFGTVGDTVLNGPMLSLDPGHESEIVAALRAEGHTVERHDRLIEELYA
jgi:hypothetical protein